MRAQKINRKSNKFRKTKKRQRGGNQEAQEEKDTYLFDAIDIYDYDKVENALNNGANVNALNKYGDTPLIRAIRVRDIDMVYLLLERPDINIELELATNKELQLAEDLEEDDQDQSGIPYAIEDYIVTKKEKKRIQNIVAQTIPKHLDRQQDRKELAARLSKKGVGSFGDGRMPYELRHEIGKYLGGGKRKTKTLTLIPSPEKESVDDCPICTEPMDNINDIVNTKPCNHTFHQDCLRSWCLSQTNTKCPLCRTPIPDTCETDLGVGVPAYAPRSPDYAPGSPDYSPVAEMNWMDANIQDEQAMEEIVARIRNGDSTNLRGVDLLGADLSNANLTRVDLTNSILTGADLSTTNLVEANLTHADLTYADLTEANLERANLTGTDLSNADLTGADLTGANLTGAYLQGANFTNVLIVNEATFGSNTGTPIGLPNDINLNGGKRKTRKAKKSKKKSKKSKRKTRKTRN